MTTKHESTGPTEEGITKRFGDGIYARWSKRRQCWTYAIQYWWHEPDTPKARKITEQVPADKDGKCRLESAKRLKAKREKLKHAPDFVPPHLAERRQLKAQVVEVDRRAPLLYESAVARFFVEALGEYSRPDGVRAALGLEPGKLTGRPGPVTEAFRGRYLDEITRVEIRQYFLDRIRNTGPFEGRTRKLSQRAPETEIAFLSALYTYLQDAGHTIDNPCHRPRTGRGQSRRLSPLAPYRPAHKAVIPDDDALRAILTAELRAKKAGPHAVPGRELVDKYDRALVALCYYTAARPESEPCRLTHGDVELGEGEAWGAVNYRDTKTGGDRRVLLHPDAERYLRAAMEPEPPRPATREPAATEAWKAARAAWAALPIFRRRPTARDGTGGPKPWDKSSYGKAWANIRRAVIERHPEVAGMWLRDLRKVAKTRMVDAGVPTETTKAILGHRGSVADGYYQLNDAAQQRALESLTLKAATVSATGPESVMQYHASRVSDEAPEMGTSAAS